jgi:beta-lactamase regulating signal transducer with metallopeptidase domain
MILFFAVSVITFIIQSRVEAKPVAAHSFTIRHDVPVINSASGLMDNFIAWVDANSDTVVLAWAFFFLLSCLRLVTGLAAVNRLRHYKTHPVTAEWKAKLEQLQLVIGVRHSVSLLQSELVKVPMALGILKPVIFLPLGLLTHLPTEQVETILLHELAHIRRRDYLVNLLQHVTEAIFFFNPAMRWLSSLIRQEREACCDDIVIANCNQKSNYLHALISFQEYSLCHSSYAMGISCKRHYLLNRVKRMITNKNKGVNFFEKIALLAGVFLFSAFSYVTKEPKGKNEPVIMQQPAATVLPIVVSKPEHLSVKKEKKKINHLNTPVTDTVPAKKSAVHNSKSIDDKKPVTKLDDREQAAKDADATLLEIIQIKNQIGLKKESIGIKKAQLTMKDGQEKEKIQKEIDEERCEIDEKRRELDRKREQWQELKKQAEEKLREQKNTAVKTVTDKVKLITIQGVKDAVASALKNNYVSADFSKELNFKIDNNKLIKQEFKYQMDLQLKDPPPAKPRPAPEDLKTPGAPAKKAQPVKS